MDLEYFHGQLSREEAEKRLFQCFRSGDFLIRRSNNELVLSMVHIKIGSRQTLHFRFVSLGECWFCVDDGQPFEGIDKAVTYYARYPDGLPVRLGNRVPRPNRRSPQDQLAGNSPLHDACATGDSTQVMEQMKHFFTLNAMGRTPLHVAVIAGHEPIVDLLLSDRNIGRIINIADHDGWTALHYAALQGNGSTVQGLIVAGGSPRPVTSDGETPQNIAARLGNVEACKMLGHALSGYTSLQALNRLNAPYYHGGIARRAAEYILKSHGYTDGLFLIRDNSAGGFSLSLVDKGACYHYDMGKATSSEGGPEIYKMFEQVRPRLAAKPPTTMCVRGGNCMPVPESAPPPQPQEMKLPDNAVKLMAKVNIDQYEDLEESAKPSATAFTHQISDKDLIILSPLGQGEFGEVFKGLWIQPNGKKVDCAIKQLRANQEDLQRMAQLFFEEAHIMSQLHHPNVVRLLGTVRNSYPLMIVQELVPLGSLQDYLENKKTVGLSTLNLVSFCHQIAIGMAFLESKKFVHRDLATRNVLVATPQIVKISDFGFTRAVNKDDIYTASTKGKWPIKWYAPECILYGRFSHKSDVWSYGVTMWEIFTYADIPYGDTPGTTVVLDMIPKGQRLSCPADCPESIHAVMLMCWEYEERARPDFKTLAAKLLEFLR
eukprot:m.137631 g.137631  ORF g.137631 m.137631 type:complete len:658 (+) comp16606_c0_seq6:658-2631(+)